MRSRVVPRYSLVPFLGAGFFFISKKIKGDKNVKEKLQSIKEEALAQIQAADAPEKLNDVKVRFLGKKGELTAVLKGMKDVAAEDRPRWSACQ